MALFNQPIQQTTDVTAINNQIQEEGAAKLAHYNQIMQAEYAYRQGHAKLISEVGPLLGKYNQLRKYHQERQETELESKLFEDVLEIPKGKYENQEEIVKSYNAQATSAGSDELYNGGNVLLAGELLSGNKSKRSQLKLLTGLRDDMPSMFNHFASNLEFPREDGVPYTLATARTAQELKTAKHGIRALILQQGMANGTNLYQRTKYLHKAIKTEEQYWTTKFVNAQRTAVESQADIQRTNNLKDTILSEGPAAFVDHINSNASFYSKGLDPDSREAKQLSRAKTVEKIVTMIQDGTLTPAEAQKFSDDLKTHQIYGSDKNFHVLGKYWRKEIESIDAAIEAKKKSTYQAKADSYTVEKGNYALGIRDKFIKIVEGGGVVTEDMISEELEAFKKQFPGESQLPEIIDKWYTAQDNVDEAIVERLENRYRNRETITTDDLKGITDVGILATWLPRVKESSMFSLSEQQIKDRDAMIKAAVVDWTKESEGTKDKSPKYVSNMIGARNYFNDRYAENIKANPDNPIAAHSQAFKDTQAAIELGAFDSYINEPLDGETAKNTQRALAAFAADSNIINTTVLPGTKGALKQMAKIIETGKGEIPAIYRLLSTYTGASPYTIGATQVSLAQDIEGGPKISIEPAKVDQDVDEQLSFDERLLLLKKGSDGRTNRVLQNAETLNWYLENIQDDTAVANGGYDYILSPTGGDAHLEKPLTEHTVAEVLDLLRTGHQAPGIYTFTPSQLIQALNVSNISAEDKFDENTQNLLALNQSRWRIQTQGNLQGFYNDWRELGTLKPEDLAKQTEIAENIPSVWNQRQNLLEALIN